MKIGEFLIRGGHISRSNLDQALQEQAQGEPRQLLGQILVSMGALDQKVLFQQLMAFVREKSGDSATLREWITQEEINSLLAGDLGPS